MRACASNRETCSCARSARPARKAKAGTKRAKAAKPKGGLHLPAGLEQRHLDLIGLFLVAFGVYLVFVLFFGWEGGKVGYGVETGLTYLFGTVGARIFTVLMLLVGGMLLTGTSVSALARGIGRGVTSDLPRPSSTAATRRRRRSPAPTPTGASSARPAREAETVAGATDVMSSYPDTDEFEPTVQLAEEPEDEPDLALAADDFDRELEEHLDRPRRTRSPSTSCATTTRPTPSPWSTRATAPRRA